MQLGHYRAVSSREDHPVANRDTHRLTSIALLTTGQFLIRSMASPAVAADPVDALSGTAAPTALRVRRDTVS